MEDRSLLRCTAAVIVVMLAWCGGVIIAPWLIVPLFLPGAYLIFCGIASLNDEWQWTPFGNPFRRHRW